jgi:hypothetical protein
MTTALNVTDKMSIADDSQTTERPLSVSKKKEFLLWTYMTSFYTKKVPGTLHELQ